MIPVTQPFLPPKKEFEGYLDTIWQRNWLTNMGPFSTELEEELTRYLKVSNLLFVTNGTVALQMAIKALELKGEIITTPFSFVATTSSIVWESCTPVFVDIDKDSLNIDADKIEAAITSNTTAILATHVYGNPCDVVKIEKIAKKYNLKVIYDGAHAFGVEMNGKSIFEYGDISTCSLHATKLYHSTEGGLVICRNEKLAEKLKYIRNFGISGFDSFAELGINGKNSEFHAAMGLANLKYVEQIHEKRKLLADTYFKALSKFDLQFPVWNEGASRNYAYFPVLFSNEEILIKIVQILSENEIQTRRYFYPSLAQALPYLKKSTMPITEDIAKRVLCLPFYYDLSLKEVKLICQLISKSYKE
ncbi:MAG: DegT/DnrJ/EryC1/StrS family aminotransferase [Weeksellaceae bacterium]|jgi:dTDP-4-amino-4,6-dideoxygalactose transaminase|nr:DegT/DnrJ/EryC1/StrS family aminotransferase [Weeksellaceae bacterium]